MIASTHLAVGAAVGLAVQYCLPSHLGDAKKLVFACAAGIASHILLDSFPHEEYRVRGFDLGLLLFFETAFIITILFSPEDALIVSGIIFFGMVGGALPDLFNFARDFTGWQWLARFCGIIHYSHGSIPVGQISITAQILITTASVIFSRWIKPA